MTTPLKIGLFWHSFRSGNLGVSALTDANMSLITDAAEGRAVEFVIFGPRGLGIFDPPKEFKATRNITVSSIRKAKPIYDEIQTCDLVFDIGAGDSFADIYGWKRLAKTAGLKVLARLAGHRPILSPQTIGPFTTTATRAVGKYAIRSCKTVFARDTLSYDRAVDLIGQSGWPSVQHASDVAFGLKRLSDWPDAFPALDTGKRNVGINVSGLLQSGGYSGNNQFGLSLDYPALMRRILKETTERADLQVWLIPHVFRSDKVTPECDRTAALSLQQEFPSAQVAPIFRNAREAKTFIGSMDLMLAARMHAAIAAVSSGVACLPMSYSIKFQGLFESLDYPYTIDLKGITEDDAVSRVVQGLNSIESMAEKAAAARDLALEALGPYRAFVAREIQRVGGKG